jgi:flagellar basal-body rod protein FlgB
MDLTSIPLLDVLRQRMSWLSARQNLLSQNVANADTPGYAAQDLKPLDFAKLVRDSASPTIFPGLAVTDRNHIAAPTDSTSPFETTNSNEAGQSGNAVSVEEEMMKVADTQAQYQAATNIYAKAINMMRTAIDRSGS